MLSLSFSMILSLRHIRIPMHFGRSSWSCAFCLWHLQIAWQGRMCGNLPDIFSCPSKTDLFVNGIWFVWKQNRISWVTRWGRCVCAAHTVLVLGSKYRTVVHSPPASRHLSSWDLMWNQKCEHFQERVQNFRDFEVNQLKWKSDLLLWEWLEGQRNGRL